MGKLFLNPIFLSLGFLLPGKHLRFFMIKKFLLFWSKVTYGENVRKLLEYS